ncbi:MAG: leucine-rich repeat domain-containing protein, partial [Bacteroidota bacterium]
MGKVSSGSLVRLGNQELTEYSSPIYQRGLQLVKELEKDRTISFPDPELEAVVRISVGKPDGDLKSKDIKSLKVLNAPRHNISSLQGIEQLVSLKEIHLMGNQVESLDPLEHLVNLRIINLSHNRITNLKGLAKLKNLHRLYLGRNQINDLQPLTGLTKLKDLVLSYNEIEEIQ